MRAYQAAEDYLLVLALRLELKRAYQAVEDYLLGIMYVSLCVCDFGSAPPTPGGNESQLA